MTLLLLMICKDAVQGTVHFYFIANLFSCQSCRASRFYPNVSSFVGQESAFYHDIGNEKGNGKLCKLALVI